MIIKRKTKRAPYRPRGGATALCPVNTRRVKTGTPTPCGEISRVLRTTRDAVTGHVLRIRRCSAGHRFTTEEKPE